MKIYSHIRPGSIQPTKPAPEKPAHFWLLLAGVVLTLAVAYLTEPGAACVALLESPPAPVGRAA